MKAAACALRPLVFRNFVFLGAFFSFSLPFSGPVSATRAEGQKKGRMALRPMKDALRLLAQGAPGMAQSHTLRQLRWNWAFFGISQAACA
jgi:hypothetical protein